MLSTQFDRELLSHFVPYYVGIGVEPRNMYIVLHSEGGVQEDIDATMRIIGNYSINYQIYTDLFISFTKFDVLVCARTLVCMSLYWSFLGQMLLGLDMT